MVRIKSKSGLIPVRVQVEYNHTLGGGGGGGQRETCHLLLGTILDFLTSGSFLGIFLPQFLLT